MAKIRAPVLGASVATLALVAALVFLVSRSRDGEPEPAGAAAIGTRQAVARLQPVGGSRTSGTVSFFSPAGDAGLGVARYRLRNLPAGAHRLRIHRHGDCSAADGASAGVSEIDLGELHAAPSGRAQGVFHPKKLTVDGVVGKAAVLSAASSGPPLACGVVQLR